MAMPDDAVKITKTGVTINVTTSAVTPTLLPTNEPGEFPRAVRFSIDAGVAYIRVGVGAPGTNSAYLTPTLADILVTPNDALYLSTRGMQYFSAITRANTCNLNAVAIEC